MRFGRQRLGRVSVTVAGAVAAGAVHAAAACPGASAAELLGASPSADATGFALTRQLCGTTLVRDRARAALPEAVVTVASPRAEPPAAARAPASLPAPRLKPVVSADASGQARVQALAPLMAEVALRHDIDPLLLHAVAHIESRHQAQAVSPAGARGLMQVMPATGRRMGIAQADRELLSPQANLEASARYLKLLQARFGNNLTLVLAAYNAGEGAVERHGRRVPPYAETQAYVRNVLAVYGELHRRLTGVRT